MESRNFRMNPSFHNPNIHVVAADVRRLHIFLLRQDSVNRSLLTSAATVR
jgi:hypothetical protein